jgi:hypothetical protein
LALNSPSSSCYPAPSHSPGGRKSELKRGRFVDKNKEPPSRTMALKRSDSLTKREKQSANQKEKEASEAAVMAAYNAETVHVVTSKLLKTLANQKKRIRRRHTVGGTKDFAEWNDNGKENNRKKLVVEANDEEKENEKVLRRMSLPVDAADDAIEPKMTAMEIPSFLESKV